MTRSHCVLFIAYNFPPHGGAGVQRSTNFVKHLPEFGWRPLVVTTSEDASQVTDRSLAGDLPQDCKIYRVPGFSISRLQRAARRYRAGKAVVGLNLLLQLPDAGRFWARKVRSVISDIVEQHQPALIYTTSGPYSSHLVGKWARERYEIPWLADFRDPWSKNLLVPYLPGYRQANRVMERSVLESADRVVCVSESWLNELRENCRDCRDKFVTIANGYDSQRVKPLPPRRSEGRFTITHVGTFYTNRRPDALVRAVDLLIDTGRLSVDQLRLVFVGKNARDNIPNRSPFETHDYVPHERLQTFRQECDALLLILSTSPANAGNYSGKIYEYIASNRPILAIVPLNGVAQNLIEKTRTGIAVGGDVGQIADAIEMMYRQWQAGFPDWDPNWPEIRTYTRRNLTAKLAAVFNEMVAEAGR